MILSKVIFCILHLEFSSHILLIQIVPLRRALALKVYKTALQEKKDQYKQHTFLS